MAENNLFGFGKKAPSLCFRLLSLGNGESSTSPRAVRGRHAPLGRAQAQRRMTQDRPTNPVNYARADAARASWSSKNCLRQSLRNAQSKRRKLRLRMRLKTSFFSHEAGPCGAGGAACSHYSVGGVYAGKLMQSRRRKHAQALDPTVTLTGPVKVG